METIKEMAVAYLHEHNGCCNIEDFEAGANAVLEEIETLMSNGNDKFPYTCVDSIQNLIKQLKGEL